MVNDLKQNYIMLLRNHGAITCEKKIHKTMFYAYHLEQACQKQCLLNSTKQQELIMPSEETCKQPVKDLLSFKEDLGKRYWDTWLRMMSSRNL